MVRNIGCSSKGPTWLFTTICNCSTRGSDAPSDLCWHQTHTWDTDILAGKILVHIKKERAVKKKKKTTRNNPSVKRNRNGGRAGVDKKETNSKGIKMFQSGR